MSIETLQQFANLALVPVVGLLWRISTQLAALNATMEAHHERLDKLERRGPQ